MGLYDQGGKRLLDLTFTAIAVAVLSPVLVVTAVLIRLGDGGPAIFRQRRIGRDGSEFMLLKFRSMSVDTAERTSDQAGTLVITPVGRFIRRTNLDELPQLINVVRGEMSLVGPRPALLSQRELTELRTASGAIACRPGLTGLAQVSAYDGMSVKAKAAFDAAYAGRITLLGDIAVMFRTLGYLTRQPPVY